MGLFVSFPVILYFLLGVLLLYALGWLLMVPLKKGLFFLFNSGLGLLILWILGFFSEKYGFSAVINPFSAILTGFLGLPGVLLTLAIQNLL